MFNNISWATYLVVITLLLATYYLVIGLRFYCHELQTYLAGWLKPGPAEPSQAPAPPLSLDPLPEAFLAARPTPSPAGNHRDNPAWEAEDIPDSPLADGAEANQEAGDQREA